jgi:hypothetical protein
LGVGQVPLGQLRGSILQEGLGHRHLDLSAGREGLDQFGSYHHEEFAIGLGSRYRLEQFAE